ncbi:MULTISPECIES: alpha-N-acetylglucosaminidase TIM-barrel domain-containing protein [Kribbella]|uniref:alpha-N-acetylglucosaminidase TIM-barrel domain-containing protein n=1 Tax=Kribbella TaxID=182639 RepID=UPI002F4B46A1
MRSVRVVVAGVVAAVSFLIAPAAPAAVVGPARDALVRLVGQRYADQVVLQTLDRGAGKDVFRVGSVDGKVLIAGTTPAVQLTGFGWYLRHVAHADIELEGAQLNLPARLPLPAQPTEQRAAVDNRFALNDTNEGYAGPYLSWSQWQRRIDVLALHGINQVLVYEGQEAVYEQAFQKFGYRADELRAWIPQPAHQAWWLLQNECCLGSPISQQLIDRRTVLGRQMADHLRELGMVPVLPGYFGTVPPDFAAKNPGAKTVPQGKWDGLARPDWLDPTNPLFAQVAAEFYRVQTDLFGPSTMYKMDLLHEGGTPGDVSVPDASRAVQNALEAAHPGAIWAILGWQKNPLPATLQSIDRSKMLVVDGISEASNITDRDKDFLGTPYAFGTIWNFGGHSNLGASLAAWNEKFHAWLAKPGTALNGIALMPEAIDNNPAAVAFFTDLAWQSEPVNLQQWFTDYATSRYGVADPQAIAAWQTLGSTVYSWPAAADSKHPTGLFDYEPSLGVSGTAIPYDPEAFRKALGELLAVSPAARRSTAYRYDLVDVARQVVANDSRTLLPRISAAYQAKDLQQFRKLTADWLQRLKLLDDLLGTDNNFLLGSWLAGATAQAANPEEAAALRYDVRTLITDWTATATLQDYARREWNGLVGDYYAGRWRTYFAALDKALSTGQPVAPIDWKAYAEQWAHTDTQYPVKAQGDAYQLASRVAAVPSGSLSVEPAARGVRPGETVRVTATYSNGNTLRAAQAVRVSLTAPASYGVKAVGPTVAAQVPAGGTFKAVYDVTVPAGAHALDLPVLAATVNWEGTSEAASTRLLVTGDVGAPWKTVSTNDASFAVSGDRVGIAGGGSDMWKDTDEHGAVYQQQVLSEGQSVTTRVTSQDRTAPYARAGLLVDDANIAVTPDHGCMFSWDSNGDGMLDSYTAADGFKAPVYVRIARTDGKLSGACSEDGENWTTAGSAVVPGEAAVQDVGVFMSAVNTHTGTTGVATFEGFDVAPYTPRDSSGDTVLSVRKPVTALGEEAGHPATAANDGSRSNNPYWGGPLGPTWWQVDLGAASAVSTVNVRNYVDGTRYYNYRLLGSVDGTHWFLLGGRFGTAPVVDAGDTFRTEATARYVRVEGLSNSANNTFHLTEVTVSGR